MLFGLKMATVMEESRISDQNWTLLATNVKRIVIEVTLKDFFGCGYGERSRN